LSLRQYNEIETKGIIKERLEIMLFMMVYGKMAAFDIAAKKSFAMK
jgi:hypothetical protein